MYATFVIRHLSKCMHQQLLRNSIVARWEFPLPDCDSFSPYHDQFLFMTCGRA